MTAEKAAEKTAEEYRQRAEEMKMQAQRAETVYLQAIYSSIADNWDRLAEQMRTAEERAAQIPPPPKMKSNRKGHSPRL